MARLRARVVCASCHAISTASCWRRWCFKLAVTPRQLVTTVRRRWCCGSGIATLGHSGTSSVSELRRAPIVSEESSRQHQGRSRQGAAATVRDGAPHGKSARQTRTLEQTWPRNTLKTSSSSTKHDLPEFLRNLFRVISLPFSKHARTSTKITVFGPTASATRAGCFFIKHRRPFTNTFSSSETGKEDYPHE